MRKLAMVLSVLAATGLMVETAAAQGLSIKGGLNMANIGGDDAVNPKPDSKNGLVFGAALQFPMGPMISLQPELLYVDKGAAFEEEGVEMELALQYVEIPLLLRISAPMGALGAHLVLGPSVAFNTGCKFKGSEGGFSAEVDCDVAEFEVETMDFGGIVGGGIGLPMGPGSIGVEARYNLGLRTIDKADQNPQDLKNRGFNVMLGYTLQLGL